MGVLRGSCAVARYSLALGHIPAGGLIGDASLLMNMRAELRGEGPFSSSFFEEGCDYGEW